MNGTRPAPPQDALLVTAIDWVSPVDVAQALHPLGDLVFLDSAMQAPELGRYSYIGAAPLGIFEVTPQGTSWCGKRQAGPPLRALADLLAAARIQRVPGLPPFQGGALGMVAYECAHYIEDLPRIDVPDIRPVHDLVFGFYDTICAFDHVTHQAWVIATNPASLLGMADRATPDARTQVFLGLLRRKRARSVANLPIPRAGWSSNFDASTYAQAVERVRGAILAGDVFQANIAQCFTAHLPEGFDPWVLYRRLRTVNPGTFAAFLDLGSIITASASPERFFSLREGRVETRPIKGTAVRASDPLEDQRLAQGLAASDKDRAENIMIVDLMRSDLSRVAAPESVCVSALCAVESYAGVHHLVSVVQAVLSPGKTAVDVLAACFPGGSITGAPKIRAMQLISAIEGRSRGVYCGAIGYLAFNGDADFSIAIRTVTLDDAQARFHVGGGVTVLSDPMAEYNETLAKAERLFQAFS